MRQSATNTTPNRTVQTRTLWIICLFVLAQVNTPFAQVPLQCSTPEVVLGTFSATDGSDNLWTVGSTQFALQSAVPWELVGQLTEPVRRVEDGLEMPMERVRDLFQDVGEEFASYEPFRIDYGPGIEMENQFVEFGWEVLQLRIADFLEAGDPVGVYRTHVDFAVRDRAGEWLSERVSVLFEFEILPWLELELPQTGLQLIVNNQHEPAESEPLPIHIRSNAAWDLRLALGGDLIEELTGETISSRFVLWKIEAGGNYQSLIAEFQPVSLVSLPVAGGDAPPPFAVSETVLPLRIRCDAMGLTAGGRYAADLSVDAAVREEAR